MYVGVEMSPRLQLFVEDAICIRSSRRCVRNSDSSGQNFFMKESPNITFIWVYHRQSCSICSFH